MADFCLQVRKIVPKVGAQRTEYLLNTRRYRGAPENAYVASMPQIWCTFQGDDFYLLPGTQDHPDNLKNPVKPNPTVTWIDRLPGK